MQQKFGWRLYYVSVVRRGLSLLVSLLHRNAYAYVNTELLTGTWATRASTQKCLTCSITMQLSSLPYSCLCGVKSLLANAPELVKRLIGSIATIYLELWKRRQASLAWEWDLMDAEFGESAEIRLEYELAASDVRMSPVTKQHEPYMPPWKKNVRFALSAAGVFFIVRSPIRLHN